MVSVSAVGLLNRLSATYGEGAKVRADQTLTVVMAGLDPAIQVHTERDVFHGPGWPDQVGP
jgi:hypothetical protein